MTSTTARRGASELRRGESDTRIGFASEVRCECGRSNCSETLPAVAETHRGMADRLLVLPEHANGEIVVRIADRFFVVERNRRPVA
jgi:hypothetical protein